jgi:hypothetical protein
MDRAALVVFFRWTIGLTFAISAIGKATATGSFREAVAAFGVTPRRLNSAIVVATICAEGLIVVLVAVGSVFVVGGFGLALVLLAFFSAVLARALMRKVRTSCNCFGRSQRNVTWYDVVRNGVLGLCSAGGLWCYGPATGHLAIADDLELGLIAAGLMIIVTHLGDIVELLHKPYVVE